MNIKKLQARVAASCWALASCCAAIAQGNCEQLKSLGNAKVEISTAEVVHAGVFTPPGGKPLNDLPSFCRVAALLRPTTDSSIHIELWMPEANWNGRLEGTGNGGFAGSISYGSLAAGVKSGYAVVNTDMGMATPPGEDATAFIGHPGRWKDWGYRSTHEMTIEAKRLVASFYQRAAAHNYFVGCSTGGEQALMEAQRFPEDYDGIVAGAPANNRTGVHLSILWNFMWAEQQPESRIPPAKLSMLAKAVMNACDALDGVTDGMISDPTKCPFDAEKLACSGADNDHCLTSPQLHTVDRLYSGPVNPRTGKVIYPGMPRGSELGWDRLVPWPKGQPPFWPIFTWALGRDFDWRNFDFDRSVTTVEQKLGADLNATSPDLEAFRKQGHKLIIYHGWADWLVVPAESINYRNALAAGPSAKHLDEFYALYMVPGMYHCGGGTGADHFDALSAMVDWVEKGHAPQKLLATQFKAGDSEVTPLRTRPLCPYPQVAQYSGHGSSDDAANFVCAVTGK